MKFFFELGNRYLKESDWKDLALMKFCLWGMGVLIGALSPKKHQKKVIFCAAAVFLATYIPLMMKLARIVFSGKEN